MTIETQIATCDEHYQLWKNKALFTKDIYEAKKALERAFFWLELRSAFIMLYVVEQTKGHNIYVKQKLIKAKVNLSKKLSKYAEELLKDINK